VGSVQDRLKLSVREQHGGTADSEQDGAWVGDAVGLPVGGVGAAVGAAVGETIMTVSVTVGFSTVRSATVGTEK